ncbi:hypothetical protein NDU88_002274 [Pleurodeles waltl]|uniref:Uncharacterized protein n=1 Tax=Pleurodeles waltl TaxID=8319 RepID=A0AAV7LDP7_PLEWA|nr:hypothetical protein NDU88_002274 [Pleurodeles waltl]
MSPKGREDECRAESLCLPGVRRVAHLPVSSHPPWFSSGRSYLVPGPYDPSHGRCGRSSLSGWVRHPGSTKLFLFL